MACRRLGIGSRVTRRRRSAARYPVRDRRHRRRRHIPCERPRRLPAASSRACGERLRPGVNDDVLRAPGQIEIPGGQVPQVSRVDPRAVVELPGRRSRRGSSPMWPRGPETAPDRPRAPRPPGPPSSTRRSSTPLEGATTGDERERRSVPIGVSEVGYPRFDRLGEAPGKQGVAVDPVDDLDHRSSSGKVTASEFSASP